MESDIIDRYFCYHTEARIKQCSKAFCCFSQLKGVFEDSIEEGSNAFVLVSIQIYSRMCSAALSEAQRSPYVAEFGPDFTRKNLKVKN